jgi:hypothetical protein
MPKQLSEDEGFALLAQGRKCTGCGNPEVVMISIPSTAGEPFTLEEIGEKCWCKNCALTQFVTQGKA